MRQDLREKLQKQPDSVTEEEFSLINRAEEEQKAINLRENVHEYQENLEQFQNLEARGFVLYSQQTTLGEIGKTMRRSKPLHDEL